MLALGILKQIKWW